ncbi:hypothetical protein N5079_28040 [Planotetraspora sp. A-T 1434]|uniref:alpha/beta hydrolase family protein n=1 Tax=Planotetraspora sp. A-T 1434 TaxID=2979219 RepID=UPI0021BDF375|nr:hypothetical protein [Planotetraspora sp. A-T 1434]MCT9934067.1 hypothetical protein [Planotetraspora sp. A-T 1434]
MLRKPGMVVPLILLTACGGTAGTASTAANSPGSPAASPASPTTPAASPAATGPNVQGCFTEADGRVFTYPDADGDPYTGVIIGDGPVGVVVSYERGGDVCTWRPLAERLKAAGYRALLYDRSALAPVDDLIVQMAGRLRKAGVKRLFLVGGSVGGHMSIVAATRLKRPVAGVVNLSGVAIADEAAPLGVPLLQITAEDDGSAPPAALEEAARAAVKSPDRPVVVVRGEHAHASSLFGTAQGPKVLDTIMAFLAKHD